MTAEGTSNCPEAAQLLLGREVRRDLTEGPLHPVLRPVNLGDESVHEPGVGHQARDRGKRVVREGEHRLREPRQVGLDISLPRRGEVRPEDHQLRVVAPQERRNHKVVLVAEVVVEHPDREPRGPRDVARGDGRDLSVRE